MSDFVRDLRSELVAAAAREEARGVPRVSWPVSRLLFLGAAVAATAAIVVVLATGGLRSEPAHHDAVPGARPTPEGRQLFGGTLEEGVRFRTQAFIPALSFVAVGPNWEVRDATSPETLGLIVRSPAKDLGDGLKSEGPPAGALVFLRITQVYDPDVKGLQRSVTTAPADLYTWLRAHPDISVGPEKPVTVAGVPGRRFDAAVRFDRPVHEDPLCKQRTLEVCTFLAPNLSLFDGDVMRVTILQTEPDPLIIVEATYPDGDRASVQKQSDALLKTLRIGVG